MIGVLKFGGSSFLGLDGYGSVARYLADRVAAGERLVCVVSAMSGTTGRLLEAARALDPDLEPEVQDEILATGEMVSAGFLRAALRAEGISALSLCAPQLGLRSDGPELTAAGAGPVRSALASHSVVVVAGGQAIDGGGRVRMLGRNRSDLTAVVLAAALQLPGCEIFSDVAGVYTADPYVVPSARLLPGVSYAQCEAMAAAGAKVLHGASVAVAREHAVRISCRALVDGEAVTGSVIGLGLGTPAVTGDRARGLVTVVGPDGSARASEVPPSEVDSAVLAEHGELYGRHEGVPALVKARSGHSGLLTGVTLTGVTQ
ncbi:MAG: aspartate kinase [Cryptosporangiaceae bacterium]|nr:aspartate kinase [Cryptosporangiaceae bacterium]